MTQVKREIPFVTGFVMVCIVPAQIVEMVPASLRIATGQTATFKCITSGDPAPTVTWFKENADGVRVPAVGEEDLDNEDARIQTDGGLLVVKNATTDDDGVYLCQADNNIGPRQHLNASLDVLGMTSPAETVVSTKCPHEIGAFNAHYSMLFLVYIE
jgi:hypothetical protein